MSSCRPRRCSQGMADAQERASASDDATAALAASLELMQITQNAPIQIKCPKCQQVTPVTRANPGFPSRAREVIAPAAASNRGLPPEHRVSGVSVVGRGVWARRPAALKREAGVAGRPPAWPGAPRGRIVKDDSRKEAQLLPVHVSVGGAPWGEKPPTVETHSGEICRVAGSRETERLIYCRAEPEERRPPRRLAHDRPARRARRLDVRSSHPRPVRRPVRS